MHKKISFTLFFVLLFSFHMNSQTGETDSLLRKLNTAKTYEKAAIYNRLAKTDAKNNPEKRIKYATEALSIAGETGQIKEKLTALMQIATGYAYLGDNNKALEYDLQALETAQKIKDDKQFATVYLNLGYDYYYAGIPEKALEFNLKSLEAKNRLLETGRLNSDKSFAASYNNIGSLYNMLGNYDKAIEYHNKALNIREKYSDSAGIATSLHNMGTVYEKMNKNQKAGKYYRNALTIRKKLGNKRQIAETLNNLGVVYKKLNDDKQALNCYFQAIELFKTVGDKGKITAAANNIAGLYIKEKKPDKAFPFIKKSLEAAGKTGQKQILPEIYENLAGYYVLKNDFKNAYLTQKKMLALKDSTFRKDMTDKLSEMQVKYETERKEKEIEILARDKEIHLLKIKKQSVQLYFLLAFIILAGLISILIFSRFRLKQKHYRIELEKKNLETEQRLLRSQMNPHFIFNSMNSIQSYISGNDSFTAMTYLSKFAQLMRNILENSRKPFIVLSEEIETLKLYIELERIRFKQKFDYKITVEPDLPVDSVYIPPMLIQPFVENSIKHGLRNKKEKGLLEIEFRKDDKFIRCFVKDNGVGREKAGKLNNTKNKEHRSLGIQVTKERLDTLSRLKGLKVSYMITDLKDSNGNAAGTEVVIKIPYEEE